MAIRNSNSLKKWALASAALTVIAHGAAFAQNKKTVEFDIDAQELGDALNEFGLQSGKEVFFLESDIDGKHTDGLEGNYSPADAINLLLDDTGVKYRDNGNGTILIGEAYIRQASLQGDAPRGGVFRVAQLDQEGDVREIRRDEDVEDDKSEKDVIVVTGSNIRGVSPDSSPSYVFDREDIEKTGFGTTSEFIQSLPQNFGGGSNADVTGVVGLPNDRTAGDNLAFGSSVNLRGQGSGATLVLLNGNRLAPTGGLGDFVDISMIPLSAVDRVEVLTDGASAIYGADAIAGVVNFVLRDDYDGAETFVRFGSVTDGGLSEYRAGQTFGKSWDSGNALVSYEFFHRDNLGAEERSFSATAPLPRDLLPEQESHNVLLSGSQQLNDRVTLRGHGTYSQRDTSSVFTNTTPRTFFVDSRTKQYGGVAGAEMSLVGDWLLDLRGGYYQVTERVESTAFPELVETKSDLWSVDGKIDGTVFRAPGGEVKLAAGASYREENFSNFGAITVGDLFSEGGRNTVSAFAEAFIPIVGSDNRLPGIERLELSAAGRYDDYSDFGDTLNPKVGLLWSPLDGLNFRGTYSTSFNPPNLGDSGRTGGSVFAFNAPDPSSLIGTSLVLFDFGNNPGLGPETSTTWTAGFDSQWDIGSGNIDVSLTWFDISFDGRIETPTSNAFAVLADPVLFADIINVDPVPGVATDLIARTPDFVNLSGFGGPLWTMPGDEEFILDLRLQNLALADTSGLDFDLNYGVDLSEVGLFNVGLNASYLFKQEKAIFATSPVFDVLDTVFNPVDFRLRGSTSWSREGFRVGVFVNYTDGYVDDRDLTGMGDVPIDSWTTVDLNLSYDTEERTGNSWLDNTKLSISVLNLFDQDPPSIDSSSFFSENGFDPTNGDPLGRFISFQLTKSW